MPWWGWVCIVAGSAVLIVVAAFALLIYTAKLFEAFEVGDE